MPATRAELVALLRHLRSWIEDTSSMRAADFRARIDAALAEPEPGKTVRVRAAVCINAEGDYCVYGDAKYKDADNQAEADLCRLGVVSCYFIAADVPLPQAFEVEGEVTT